MNSYVENKVENILKCHENTTHKIESMVTVVYTTQIDMQDMEDLFTPFAASAMLSPNTICSCPGCFQGMRMQDLFSVGWDPTD